MLNTGSGESRVSEEAVNRLRSIVCEMGSVMIAFSGGVDSTFLLDFCLRSLEPGAVSAVVVEHPLLREGEADEAVAMARGMGARVHTLDLDPGHIEEVAGNTRLRCYYCKRFIFSHLLDLTRQKGIPWLLDGTNADDDKGYRPGLRALEELGVRSPLREAGLTKRMIREQSRSARLETWNKPSAPCLATRFPYDQPITPGELDKIRRGEEFLRKEGLQDMRLRVHGDIARIEVPEGMIGPMAEEGRRQRLVAALKTLGYRYVTLDLEGLRSGSMDD